MSSDLFDNSVFSDYLLYATSEFEMENTIEIPSRSPRRIIKAIDSPDMALLDTSSVDDNYGSDGSSQSSIFSVEKKEEELEYAEAVTIVCLHDGTKPQVKLVQV